MGNAQSPSSRHNEAQFEPTWSQTLPKPRAWIPQQGMAEDRFGPYSPPGRGAVSPKSIVDRRFDNDCMQKDPRLARYNRYSVPSGQDGAPVQKIKVLPNATAELRPKLRSTDNGMALQKVGTISIRKLSEQNNVISLPATTTKAVQPQQQQQKQQAHKEQQQQYKQQQHPTTTESFDLDSSQHPQTRSPTPDYMENSSKSSRGRKKSKAPNAPTVAPTSTPARTQVVVQPTVKAVVKADVVELNNARESASEKDVKESSEREKRPNSAADNISVHKREHGRKLRLFKTKSQESKHKEEHQMRARSMEYLRTDISNETQEVRHSREELSVLGSGPVTVFSSQKKLDAWDESADMVRNEPIKEKLQQEIRQAIQRKESLKAAAKASEDQTKKQHFYFGMTPGDVTCTVKTAEAVKVAGSLEEESRRVMEEFDAVLMDGKTESTDGKDKASKKISLSLSKKTSISSNEEEEMADIALHLRPTLPKKPLQLPRFSPSAAWKALGSPRDPYVDDMITRRDVVPSQHSLQLSHQQLSSKSSEMSEDEDVFEERINKNARPVAPMPARVSNEKSADSGISGDAGSPDNMLHPMTDKPLAMSSPVPHHSASNWTPEQDLGESSNEMDVTDSRPGRQRQRKERSSTPPKIIPKSQMFPGLGNQDCSLDVQSQSRSSSVSKGGRKYRKKADVSGDSVDFASNNAAGNNTSTPHKYNSLRKLKRSVSGAFSLMAMRSRSKSPDVRSVSLENGNWVLSRSAPNSIFNGSEPSRTEDKSLIKLHRSEADLSSDFKMIPLVRQYPSYSQPMIAQRIVYLPQYDSRTKRSGDSAQEMMRRAKSADAVYMESKNLSSTSSMFDVAQFKTSTPKPMAPAQRAARRLMAKRFTFQSTVRLQEKKALEEKLSREIEAKERQRLNEIQAMQRVEEEFQAKRSGDKVIFQGEPLRSPQRRNDDPWLNNNINRPMHMNHQVKTMQQHAAAQAAASAAAAAAVNANRAKLAAMKEVVPIRTARLDPEGAPSSSRSPTVERSDVYRMEDAKRAEEYRRKQMKIHEEEKRILAAKTSQQPARYLKQPKDRVVVQADYQPLDQRRDMQSKNGRENASRDLSRDKSPYRKWVVGKETSPKIVTDPLVTRHGENSRMTQASPENVAKKSIYTRLAEITNEEENISSPPPVPGIKHRDRGDRERSTKVMTQELSEYRQEQREYRDYRSPRHHPSSNRSSTPSGRYSQGSPRTPPSTSSMSDNYRWDFAHGVAPGSRPIKQAWQHNFTRDYHYFLNESTAYH